MSSRRLAVSALTALTLLVLSSRPAIATTIGPDSFGYTATNSVPFFFANISATGTRVLAGADDSTVNAALGFNFDFYGTSYNNLFISSNGLLSFGAADANFVNESLSGALAPDLPTIAVLWDDWIFNPTDDAVYYQTLGAPGSRLFVVQWNLAEHFSTSPSTVLFEAILFEGSNNILFSYIDVNTGDGNSNGASATVGIRDTSGNTNGRNLQWSFNQDVITPEEAILFQPHPVPEPGTLMLLGFGMMGLARRFRHRL